MNGELSNSLYHGVVRNGVVVLLPGESLPEGTTVTVKPEVVEQHPQRPTPDRETQVRNGVPLFASKAGVTVTLDLVNALRDEVE